MKSQGAKLSFSSVSVRWGRAGAFTLPQGTVAQRGRTLGNSRGRARLSKGTNPVRDLPGAAAGFLPAAGNRRWDFSLPGKTEARCGPTPGTSRVRARRGEEKTRCATCSPQVCSAQARAFSLPGKTEAVRGPAPKINRGRARLGKAKNRVRVLPAAGARFAHRRCAHRR